MRLVLVTAATTFGAVAAGLGLAGGIALTVVGAIEILTAHSRTPSELLAQHEAIKQAGELIGPLRLTAGAVGAFKSGYAGMKEYSSYAGKVEDALEFKEVVQKYGEALPQGFLGGTDNSSESLLDRMRVQRDSSDSSNRIE